MLDERPNEFDQRNLFLQAVLGVVSVLGCFDAALEAEGASEDRAPADDPFLLAVLGLVALRERAVATLVAVPDAERAEPVARKPPPRSSLREILR